MSKASRRLRRDESHRTRLDMAKAVQQHREAAGAGRVLPDPTMGGLEATDERGFTTKEGIEEAIASAREQGCTCPNPKWNIREVEPGVGSVLIAHDENCPFLRSITEGGA